MASNSQSFLRLQRFIVPFGHHLVTPNTHSPAFLWMLHRFLTSEIKIPATFGKQAPQNAPQLFSEVSAQVGWVGRV